MALDKTKTYHLMEVCGTHTMAIAKSGIRNVLPAYIRLVSGPGCPVCVTPPEVIDAALRLTERSNVIIATYGDMIRVPGSVKGDNLARRSAMGAKVHIVYSAMDALEIAKAESGSEVVFLGVGFETSAPGTATSVEEAKRQCIGNYSVFSMLKMLEPSIRALASDPEFNVQGFICPGHVAVILGEQGLKFFEELGLPAVIAGFDTDDIINAVRMLMVQIAKGEARLENQYTDVVRPEGNPMARELMDRYLIPRTDIWRGLGVIPESGYGLRPEYADWDAEKKFGIRFEEPVIKTACRCGDVVKGKLDPTECPLFGTVCVPEDPEGPCMVSAEGACAAAYKYRSF